MNAKMMQRVAIARRDKCGQCAFRCGCGTLCYYLHGPTPCCPGRRLAPDLKVKIWKMKDVDIPTVYHYGNYCRELNISNINSFGGGFTVFGDGDLKDISPSDAQLEIFE